MSNVWFYEPYYDFDRFIDDILTNNPRTTSGERQLQHRSADKGGAVMRPMKPRMDLHEDSKNNVVTATFELPGLKKDDVNIDVNDGRLTVSAEAKTSSERDEGGYAIRERSSGKLSRTLQLPAGIQDKDIKASLNDGILTVTFPKSAAEMPRKKIT
ncbi:Hsp20/alpha crystallin family protein, partial [Pectobacterium parmentieri]|nr:Hsp20/alpha crystallin family protein [Pectobacterium parmentieri]